MVPGVKVTLTRSGRGDIKLPTTNGWSVRVSPVELELLSVAEIAGFEKIQQNNATVDVQQKVQVDLVMTLGKSQSEQR